MISRVESYRSHIVLLGATGNTQTCLVIQLPTKLKTWRNSGLEAFKNIPLRLLNKVAYPGSVCGGWLAGRAVTWAVTPWDSLGLPVTEEGGERKTLIMSAESCMN